MTNQNEIAAALQETLISPNVTDSNLEAANVVDALSSIANAINNLAGAVHRLGNADAATPMGGLEALGLAIENGLGHIADSIAATGD